MFKFKRFRSVLSLFICLLLFLSNLQKVNCMDFFHPNERLIIFDNSYVDQITSTLVRKYDSIISTRYTLGSKYNRHMLNWRKNVMRYYRKFRMEKIYTASYFIWTLYLRKFDSFPYLPQKKLKNLDNLNGLVDVRACFVTPKSKNPPNPDIASDPNGSIQATLYYEHKEPQIIYI